MPIRLVSKVGSLGRVVGTVDSFAGDYDGSILAPGAFLGQLRPILSPMTGNFAGQYFQVQDRTGIITSSMGGFTGAFRAPAAINTNASRINAILGDYTIPFSIDYPADPVITSEATVTTSTIASNKVNGRRIILTAGDYGDQSFSTSDQEIVIQEGVYIRILTVSGTRLRFQGATPRVGRITAISTPNAQVAQDIMFDGVFQDQEMDSIPEFYDRNIIGGQRVAVINSQLKTEDFAFSAFPSNTSGPNHLWAVNNIFWGFGNSQANVRVQNAQRFVFLSNRVVKTGSTHQTFRTHASSVGQQARWHFIVDNQFEGPGLQIRPDAGAGNAGMIDIWFWDNRLYWTANAVMSMASTGDDFPYNFNFQNNVLYLPIEDFSRNWPSEPSGANWTVSNNTKVEYVSPPAWSYQ